MWLLRAVTGADRGTTFGIAPPAFVRVGRRDAQVDLALSDASVSKVHAFLTAREDHLEVADAGSSNGTFVNGVAVGTGRLRDGDRLTLGSVVLRLGTGLPDGSTILVGPRRRDARNVVIMESSLRGWLHDTPLADLLQELAAAKLSGVLVVEAAEMDAEIGFEHGAIVSVGAAGAHVESALEALREMLSWSGCFRFESRAADRVIVPALSVDVVLGHAR